METAEHAPANGQSEVLQSFDSSGLYPADAPQNEIEVVSHNGRLKVVTSHFFSPLTLEDLKKYAQDSASTVEILRSGQQRDVPNPENPDVNLFDALTQGARVKVLGDRPREVELTRERALELTAEEKAKAVEKFFRCTVRVETNAEESGIDFLFESDGQMSVTLLVGDEDAPAYTLGLTMKRPGGSKRKQFRDDFVKVDRRRKGAKLFLTTSTDFVKSVDFFDKHFESVDGTFVDGKAYGPESRERFLVKFNPWFKSEVASALVLSFGKDEQDF